METHTVVAQVEGHEITVWSTCQHPFLVRAELADLFAVPLASVRVVVPYLGGGFGSKSYTKMEPLTVALALKAGRPVRIQNRVDESMVTTRRHGLRCRMRTAMTNEGNLVARGVDCWFDTGAYADNGPRVTATGGDAAPGPYRWHAYCVDARCVYTNTGPAGSYRAFGSRPTGRSWCSSARRRSGRARARSSRKSQRRSLASTSSKSPCAGPTRASPPTTARPGRAARPRSRDSPCSGQRDRCTTNWRRSPRATNSSPVPTRNF